MVPALSVSALVCLNSSARRRLAHHSPSFQLVHQIFRKYETFSIPLHGFLLLAPPTIACICLGSAEAGWPTVSDLVFCYASYLGILAMSTVAYRLSPFHPLREYPGPFWCRTSMIWHMARTMHGKQMEYLRSLHDTYGDVVRVGEFFPPLKSTLAYH